jgi:hypothetical protein
MIAVGPAFGAILAFTAATGDAGERDCQKLDARYRVAIAGVSDALRAYEKCVAESLGRADCSGEFAELELAQDRFEIAVGDLRKGCRGEERR